MDRSTILSVIAKHLSQTVDGVDIGAIDTKKAIADYGANSLDIVEIVSSSMRELKIKIPRAELASVETIDSLVDMFEKYAPK